MQNNHLWSLLIGLFLGPLSINCLGLEAPKANLCLDSKPSQIITAENDNTLFKLFCENGLALKREKIFKKNNQVSSRVHYAENSPVEEFTYNLDGVLTAYKRFQIQNLGSVIISIFNVADQIILGLKEKYEMINYDVESDLVQLNSIKVREWFPDYIVTYDPKSGRVIRKDFKSSFIIFKYKNDAQKPYAFKEYSKDGQLISTYSIHEKFDPKKSLTQTGLSPQDIEKKLEHQKNPDRFLIGLIDSGFDYNHPDLAWKWWNNPSDPVDGIDNDQNGWVDEQFGWDRENSSPLPSEVTSDFADKERKRPDSHGTHVAHIASRDLENIALVGFAGDYTKANYIKQISNFIKKHQIKIINMSLGLPYDLKDSLNLKAASRAYYEMVSNNPNTLFVVSAGNSGHNIDLFKNKQFPANINLPNIIKVGALDTNDIQPNKKDHYKMAPWSNWGPESVDILAPGTNVFAARIGGGYVSHTGTSMAAPYVVNMAALLWMKYSDLTAAEVKKALIETAYPMPTKPKVVSKGFIDIEQALKNVEVTFFSSLVCPSKPSRQAITCCFESETSCEKAFSELSPKMKTRANNLFDKYSSGEIAYGDSPNCHWNTGSELLSTNLEFRAFEDWRLLQLTDQMKLVEIPLSEVGRGDLLYFFFEGKKRVPPSTSGGPWEWVPHFSLEHSGIALSSSEIFQKENFISHVFSIASIEQSRTAYEKSFLKNKAGRFKGKMTIKAYRRP